MRRAYTLPEVLIAGGLFLLLLGFFVPIWRLVARSWEQSGRYQDVQRSDLVLVYRLRHDYLASRPGSLLVQRGDPLVVSFLSYEGAIDDDPAWDSTGQILWRKWVAYRYLSGPGRVERSELALSTPALEPPAARPDWSAFPTPVLVASLVSEFGIPDPLPNPNTLTVQITTKEQETVSRNLLMVFPSLYGTDAAGY